MLKISDVAIDYLDDMSPVERSVFIYPFILQLSYEKVAFHLQLTKKYVIELCKQLAIQREFLPLKRAFLNALELDDFIIINLEE